MPTDLAADSVEAPAKTSPRGWRRLKAWHRRTIVSAIDHAEVLKRVHSDSGWAVRYAFMVTMSAGIAILGLLLSSPAVIIGAMLISPLMGPIIGLGFALATFDWRWVRQSLLALAAGSVLAVAFTSAVVLLSPLQDLTSEILARTRPSLFDLLVAVFSALAGGYATVRGRGETIVGVAIATALMPPLAVVGFGLATGNMLVFTGALALYATNFIAIALSAALVARFYGFGAHLTPVQTRNQAVALVLVLAALAIPLGISLSQIAWEAWATRTLRTAVQREFGEDSRIASLDPVFSRDRVQVRTTVFTDRLHDKAAADLEAQLSDKLGRPIRLRLNQIIVNEGQGRGRAELERAQVAEGAMRGDRLAQADMAARMALVANVAVEAVSVDQVARRAIAQAGGNRPLVELMQAEARLAAESPGWDVRLMPPAGPLPPFALGEREAELGPDRQEELDALAWALLRAGTDRAEVEARRLQREPAARAAARAELVVEALRARGLIVEVAPSLPVSLSLERESGLAAARAISVKALPKSAAKVQSTSELDTAQPRPTAARPG